MVNTRTVINSLVPGRSGFELKNEIVNLVLMIGISRSSYHLIIIPSDEYHGILLTVTISPGNGLVLSGIKPLPEAMLIQVSVVTI